MQCPMSVKYMKCVKIKGDHARWTNSFTLTLTLLTWRLCWASNNVRRWQMGFNLASRSLKINSFQMCRNECATVTYTFSLVLTVYINHSAWGHLNPSSYCDVGRLFYGVFKLWSKLQKKK